MSGVCLVGSSSNNTGNVQVNYAGVWGTVCDWRSWTSTWNNQAARVVCRQLGFLDGKAQYRAAFGERPGVIWLSNMNCIGEETSLDQCQHRGWRNVDQQCDHGDDVGVVCGNRGTIICFRSHIFLFT